MNRAFTLIEMVIVVAIVGILAAFLNPIFYGGGDREAPRSSCQSNLKQIGLGFLQYAQDAGGKLPPVQVSSSSGWADALQPYVKSRPIFQCSSAPTGMATDFSTDYFYNRRLARVPLDKPSEPALTILSGDGDDNAPPWNSWTRLPADALTNEASPAQRHRRVANYLFADGHVKSSKPESIQPTLRPKMRLPTFAVR